MQDLQRYIASVISLPITPEDYQQDLALKSIDEIKDNVASVVQVYENSREHCLVFKTTVFPEIADLARSLYHYGMGVKSYYRALYRAVDYLTVSIDRPQASHMKLMIDLVVEDRCSQLKSMNEACEKIADDLRKLETNIKSEKLNLERERKALDDKSATGRGHVADLKKEVEALKRLSKTNLDKEEEQQFWVPLVGFVPKAVFLNNEDGKKAADFIYGYLTLDEARTTLYSLELIQLQVDLTIRGLDKIIGSIQHVVETIQSLHDPFQAVIDALNNIPAQIKSPGQTTGDFLSVEYETVSAEWRALSDRARLYSESAWVNPVGANTFL
jgi:hypothetical protein